MKKFLLFHLLFLLFLPFSQAQFIFQKTYGGAGNDEIASVKPTSDGGYIMVGNTTSYGQGGTDARDFFVIKTDALGHLVWSRTLGTVNQREQWRGVIQTNDGGYLLSGIYTPPAVGTWDQGVAQKLDATGNQTWVQYYGDALDDEVTKSVQLTAGLGYAHIGLTENFGANVPNLQLTITGATGTPSASRVLVGGGLDNGQDIQQTSDGGLIVGGLTNSIGAGDFDFLLAKFSIALFPSLAANVSWYTSIGGPGNDRCFSVRQTTDGGYIMCGTTTSFGAGLQDMFVVKTNATGVVSWARAIGGPSDDFGWNARQTSDGGYIVAGWTNSYGQAGNNGILVKLDGSGNLSWSKSYGGSSLDQFTEVEIRTGNTGFVAAGLTQSFGSGNQAYLVTTDVNGVCGCNEQTIAPVVTNVTPTVVTTGLTNTTGHLAATHSLATTTPNPPMACQCTDYIPDFEIQGSIQACKNQSGMKYWFNRPANFGGTTPIQWSVNNATINSTLADTVFITVGTANARVFLRTNFGTCSDFYLDTIDITVDQIATNITTADSILCVGDATTLTAVTTGNQGAVMYTWNPGGSGNPINISPGVNTNYTVTATDQWLCTATDVIPVTVHPYPVVNLGPDSLYCDVAGVLLDAGNPGATYLWNTSASTQTINPGVTGTYSVAVNMNGCITRDTIDLRIGVTPTVNIMSNDTVCLGDSVHLSAVVSGGAMPYTYTWNTGLAGNICCGNAAPTANTTYIVNVEENNGCIGADTFLIEVFPYPVVNLGTDTLQCGSSGPITLDAQNPGATYNWNTGAGSQTITVSTTNIYWVDVTQNTCTTRDSISVAYSTNPVVTITGDSAICLGQSTSLSAGISGGISPYTYLWTGGSTNASPVFSPTSDQLINVTVTDSAGCVGTDDQIITVTPFPAVFLGADTILCTQPSLVLNAGNTGFTYGWQDGSTNQTFTASATGTYWVDVTNNNCTSRDSILVTFDSPQVVNLGPDQWICAGEDVLLDATNTNSTYLWSTSETTPTVTVNNPGVYWVGVTKCLTTVYDSITLSLDTFHLAEAPGTVLPTCGSADGTLGVQVVGGIPMFDYLWSSTGDTTAVITNITDGTYTVTVTDAEGCTSSTSIVLNCELPDIVVTQLVTPNNDGKNDTWIIQNIQNFPNNVVIVFNRWGNEVYRKTSYQHDWDGRPNSTLSIGTEELPAGTYFYTIDLNGDGQNMYSGYLELHR